MGLTTDPLCPRQVLMFDVSGRTTDILCLRHDQPLRGRTTNILCPCPTNIGDSETLSSHSVGGLRTSCARVATIVWVPRALQGPTTNILCPRRVLICGVSGRTTDILCLRHGQLLFMRDSEQPVLVPQSLYIGSWGSLATFLDGRRTSRARATPVCLENDCELPVPESKSSLGPCCGHVGIIGAWGSCPTIALLTYGPLNTRRRSCGSGQGGGGTQLLSASSYPKFLTHVLPYGTHARATDMLFTCFS